VSSSRAKVLTELFNPGQLQLATKRFVQIVAKSFSDDRNKLIVLASDMRAPTQSEIKYRTEILYKWLITMRGDLGYSLERTLDMLPQALRCELDGTHWTPPPAERTSWGATSKEPGNV
jgi:ribosomal protein L30E